VNVSARQVSLLFTIGARTCCLPLAHVVEVMRPLPVEPLAAAPPFVLGLAIVRGAPLPVIDGARLLGCTGEVAERFITIDTGPRRAALAVQAVAGTRLLDLAPLAELPPLVREINAEVVEKIGALDARLLVVLCAARLVPEAIWRSLPAEARP
jgi:purine-binding chemotaxis protein CheW